MLSDPDSSLGDTILEDLPFYLARAGISFRRFNEQTLRAVGLKYQAPGMASVLHALEEQDNCTVSNLVERTHLPNGTLTGLLDALERDHCIERTRNPDDGRSRRIRLTHTGRRLCAKLQQRHRMVMDMFHEALSDREADELKGLLARVTACMRAYTSDEEGTSASTNTHARHVHASPKPLLRRRRVARASS